MRVAAQLDRGAAHPQAPVRRRIAGAAGDHAVLDLVGVVAGLDQHVAPEILVGLGERRGLPEGAGLARQVEVGARRGDATASLV